MPVNSWLTYGNSALPSGSMTTATSVTHSNLVKVALSSIASSPFPLLVSHDADHLGNISTLEKIVDRNAVAIGQPVRLVSHSDDRHEFTKHCLRHAGFAGGGSVARDAISTAIGDRYRNVDHLLRERVERAASHHLLHAFPGPFEGRGVSRQIFPEIIDVRHIAHLFDVVINRPNLWRSVGIFDRRWCGHEALPLTNHHVIAGSGCAIHDHSRRPLRENSSCRKRPIIFPEKPSL